MSKISLDNFYKLIESEIGLKATLNPLTVLQKVGIVFTALVLAAAAGFMIICGIVGSGAFYAVSGCILLAFILILLVHSLQNSKKLRSIFNFCVSESGVEITDFGGNHQILWQDACSYGIVNYTLAHTPCGRCLAQDFQAFFYVCKKELDEKNLKKTLRYWNDKSASTDEIIVFPFYFNTDKREDYEVLMKYAYQYCEKSKERSYIESIIDF